MNKNWTFVIDIKFQRPNYNKYQISRTNLIIFHISLWGYMYFSKDFVWEYMLFLVGELLNLVGNIGKSGSIQKGFEYC